VIDETPDDLTDTLARQFKGLADARQVLAGLIAVEDLSVSALD
jgi:hypothetical protein